MDLYNLVNSVDIREYHKNIGYKYNSLEAAWLVYQCQSLTIPEKHDVWQWIVSNMPDVEVTNCRRFEPFKGVSLHRIITDYVDMQKRFIENFKAGFSGGFYTYQSNFKGSDGIYSFSNSDYEGFFSSWDKCVDHVLKNEDSEETNRVRIVLVKPDEGELHSHKYGYIEIDLQGRIVDVATRTENEYETDLDYFFEAIWFEFPVPFKRGDIVYVKNIWGREVPVALTDIIIPGGWDLEKYRKMRREDGGDISDMNFWGYTASGHYCWNPGDPTNKAYYEGIDYDVHFEYMDLEYYRKELTGMNRVLKPVSAWLKGEFGDDLCLLLTGYHHILIEEELSRSIPDFWSKEGLIKAGFTTKDN